MWLDFLLGSFSKNIGIDLGTSTTLIHIKGKGIVLYEPSVTAFQDGGNKILAVGEEAKKMMGEKRAVSEVAYKCGAGRVFLIDEPIAAAIGVGLPIFEPMGNLVIDIGGGTSEVAIISLGGIVVSELSQVAGDYINETISKYVKQAHNLYIN
jgi:actin-like ATPase involved in cell morphogenesis